MATDTDNPSDKATLHKRIDTMGEKLGGNIQQLATEVHRQNVQLAEYTTILRRHLATQEQINARVAENLSDHDDRIRTLEKHKAVLDATLPKRWLDADKVERDIEGLEITVGSIKATIAKWGGIITAAMIAAQLVIGPIVTKLLSLFGG